MRRRRRRRRIHARINTSKFFERKYALVNTRPRSSKLIVFLYI